jgi:hypothetical protein
MWSLQRYRSWLQNRKKWHPPTEPAEAPDSDPSGEVPHLPTTPLIKTTKPATPHQPASPSGDRIEIEPEEGDWGKILKKDE